MLHYVDLNQLSKQTFQRDIVPTVEHIVEELLAELCRIGRSKTPDPYDVWVVVDTGWSHPGHWANESTTILCDGKTGLPLTVQHVIRGHNYEGSSQGESFCEYHLISFSYGKIWKLFGIEVSTR